MPTRMSPTEKRQRLADLSKRDVTFKVWSLDVWGNARDGFEVNDRYEAGEVVVPMHLVTHNVGTPHQFSKWDAEDEAIVKALKDGGFLKKGIHTRSVEINADNGWDGLVLIDQTRDGMPVFQIEVADPMDLKT